MTTEDIERSKAIIARIFGKEVNRVHYVGSCFYFRNPDVFIFVTDGIWGCSPGMEEPPPIEFRSYSLARVCCDMKRWIGNQRVMKAIKEGEL